MRAQVHRLFFALKPDTATAAAIARAAEQVKATKLVHGRWPRGDKHHLTLHFLGDHAPFPDDVVARARAAAAQVVCAPFSFVLDHATSFGDRREAPCVLRCAPGSEQPLQMFHRELEAALQHVGLGEHLEHRPFAPHVTIARGTALAKPVAVAPIVWQACAFALVDSLVGKSIYDELGQWPLSRT